MPGARIPVDGEVTEGHSYVDESMLTGEPAAAAKAPANAVMGGTVNIGGLLRMRCLRVGSDTALAHIVQLVRRLSPSACLQYPAARSTSAAAPPPASAGGNIP